jgi:hypothetical protein
VTFSFVSISTTYIIQLSPYFFSKFPFLSFMATFCFTNHDYCLIWMIIKTLVIIIIIIMLLYLRWFVPVSFLHVSVLPASKFQNSIFHTGFVCSSLKCLLLISSSLSSVVAAGPRHGQCNIFGITFPFSFVECGHTFSELYSLISLPLTKWRPFLHNG